MLGPVLIVVEQDHAYKKKQPGPDGRKRIGCEHCGGAKLAVQHLGAAPSLNNGGTGMPWQKFQSIKKAWALALTVQLEQSGLPVGLDGILVECTMGFPDLRHRDEGNHRWMIEKALGDVLVQLGHIADDSFYPVERFQFGPIQGVHTPGRSFTQLVLMPIVHEPDPAAQLTLES